MADEGIYNTYLLSLLNSCTLLGLRTIGVGFKEIRGDDVDKPENDLILLAIVGIKVFSS